MTKELHRRKHQDSEDSWKSWHGRDYNLKISSCNILVGWDVSNAEHGLKTLAAFCTSWEDSLSLSKIKMGGCQAKLERNP